MTLILSIVTNRYSLQVADRLVTKGGSAFDSLANKSIVYSGRDCIVSMAYTGKAHIGGSHADDYIAAAIEPKCGELDSGAVFTAPPRNSIFKCRKLGVALHEIAVQLESARDPLFRRHAFELTVVGWQGIWSRKKRPHPVLIKLQKPRNSSTVWRKSFVPRHWHWRGSGFFLGVSPEGHLKSSEFERLGESIASIPRTGILEHAEAAERQLVDLIRIVANRSPFVGQDCMSVFLPHPLIKGSTGQILFTPLETHFGEFNKLGEARNLPVAYSPWMIGCNTISTPMQLMGTPVYWTAGGYPIRMKGVPPAPSDSSIALALTPPNRTPPQ
jgi:hypothetical protein